MAECPELTDICDPEMEYLSQFWIDDAEPEHLFDPLKDSSNAGSRDQSRHARHSCSTPCVSSRKLHQVPFPDDSGYADSLGDSICSTTSSVSTQSDISDSLYSSASVCRTPVTYSSSVCQNGRRLKFSPMTDSLLSPSPVIPKSAPFYRNSIFDLDDDDDQVTVTRNGRPKFGISDSLIAIPKFNLDLDVCDDEDVATDLNASARSLSDRFDSVLNKFSPRELDRLIGRKMGVAQVDIINELSSRNMSLCISLILGYVGGADLCSISQVSKPWKRACETDSMACERRLMFVRLSCLKRGGNNGKENETEKYTRGDRRMFGGNLQMVAKPSSVDQPSGHVISSDCSVESVPEMFSKARKYLKVDELLKKCPKCNCPSRVAPVTDQSICFNGDCQFIFCSRCNSEFHGARPCIPVPSNCIKQTRTSSSVMVGSRRSKKSLKRL